MSQIMVLDPRDDVDTSSAGSLRDRSVYEDEGKFTGSFADAPNFNVQPAAYYYVQTGPGSRLQIWDVKRGKIIDAESGKVIGVLSGKARSSSSGTANLTVGNEDLWAGIDSLLSANFLDATNVALVNEQQGAVISQRQVADEFVGKLRNLITRRGFTWYAPGVSVDEDVNTIEISWWRRNKALIFTVELDNTITFLKVSGPHIYNDMEEGISPTGNEIIDLWQWLFG